MSFCYLLKLLHEHAHLVSQEEFFLTEHQYYLT